MEIPVLPLVVGGIVLTFALAILGWWVASRIERRRSIARRIVNIFEIDADKTFVPKEKGRVTARMNTALYRRERLHLADRIEKKFQLQWLEDICLRCHVQ